MKQKGLEQVYSDLPKPRLLELASAWGIAGRHRMNKSSLIQALVLVRTFLAKGESSEKMSGFTRGELVRLCELKGIPVKAGLQKRALIRVLTPEHPEKEEQSMEPAPVPPASDGPAVRGEALPDCYGRTRVVLLPVHPFLVHVYWEVAEADRKRAEKSLGNVPGESKAVLRFHDLTPVPLERKRTEGGFDVEIDLDARQWYVHLWSPEKVYKVELGLVLPSGEMIVLARSNRVNTPRAWPMGQGVGEEDEPSSEKEPSPPRGNMSSDDDEKRASAQQRPVSRPLHGSDFLQKRFAEIYRDRKWNQPLSPLRPPPGGGFVGERNILSGQSVTDRCESLFTAGISSESTTPVEAKNRNNAREGNEPPHR